MLPVEGGPAHVTCPRSSSVLRKSGLQSWPPPVSASAIFETGWCGQQRAQGVGRWLWKVEGFLLSTSAAIRVFTRLCFVMDLPASCLEMLENSMTCPAGFHNNQTVEGYLPQLQGDKMLSPSLSQ